MLVDSTYGACVAVVALALVFRVAAGPRLGETAAGPAEEAPALIPSPAIPSGASLAGAELTGAGLAGPAGPGLPGPGLSRPGPPFVPGSPSFAPGSHAPFVPGATGAWGRLALPAPSDASGLTRGHPSFPGLGGAEPGRPGPSRSDAGYPDTGYPDTGYPDAGHPDPSHPYQDWAGHDEPARAPGPRDGGR